MLPGSADWHFRHVDFLYCGARWLQGAKRMPWTVPRKRCEASLSPDCIGLLDSCCWMTSGCFQAGGKVVKRPCSFALGTFYLFCFPEDTLGSTYNTHHGVSSSPSSRLKTLIFFDWTEQHVTHLRTARLRRSFQLGCAISASYTLRCWLSAWGFQV